MVQVGQLQLAGYGGQAALPAGYKPSDFPAVDYTPPFVVGNGANGGTPAAPAVGIPNNFWGFVMIMMGMR